MHRLLNNKAMKKVTTLVLMLCLTFSGALCYASGVARTENEKEKDGIPIELIESSSHSSSEKGNSIFATLDGHYLTVVFTENLGQVVMEIASTTGGVLQTYWANTPEGLQTYLPLTGNYVITFTLPNGDEYYGEFTVTD